MSRAAKALADLTMGRPAAEPKPAPPPPKPAPIHSDGPVYVWAIWRDPSGHGYRRVRAHLPLGTVLAGKVHEPTPADLLSRTLGGLESELVSEAMNAGRPWTR